MTTGPVLDAILDDLRFGLRRRAMLRRVRHAAAGTLAACALVLAAVGSATLPGGTASLAATSAIGGADVLLKGCDDYSRLACHDPLARQGS